MTGPGGGVHEWVNQTTLDPPGVLALIALGAAMLLVQRRYAVLPMILMACFVAVSQRIVVFTLDFNLVRIMVLVGWARVLLRGENRRFAWKPIDSALVMWAISAAFFYVLRVRTGGAVILKLGNSFDAVGTYFLFRCLIRSWGDLDRVALGITIVSLPVALLFLYEASTGYNWFSVFGGVSEWSQLRQGKLRARGVFPHPIMAGCFWATLMPLIAARWWRGGIASFLSVAGLVCALLIVFATASSTPVMAVATVVAGGAFFPLRHSMRKVRWATLVLLVGIQAMMSRPIWHLLARMNLFGGSTGYHRYLLIDRFIKRFPEWFLMGTSSTAHWGYGLSDVTNHFVLQGVRGGLVTLVLFLWMLWRAFAGLGALVREVRSSRLRSIYSWALGVSLLTHCASFISVSYFGQINVVWYLTLGMIGSMVPVREVRRLHRRAPSPAGPALLQ